MEYRFVSTWRLAAARPAVFAALASPDDWHQRWRWFSEVEVLARGDVANVGGRLRFVVHSPLPYSLTFDLERVSAQAPRRLCEQAVGDLEGTGQWDLLEEDAHAPVTRVRHTWTVRTTKPWMNAVAPLARPGFVWAHDVVMRDGARALADGLGVALLSADSRFEADPRDRWLGRAVVGGLIATLSATACRHGRTRRRR